jgi:heat shock protein HtpX
VSGRSHLGQCLGGLRVGWKERLDGELGDGDVQRCVERRDGADEGQLAVAPAPAPPAPRRRARGGARTPHTDLRATQELSAFYIFPPGVGKAIGGLFATHPPMEKRIAALERLEMQLQGTA